MALVYVTSGQLTFVTTTLNLAPAATAGITLSTTTLALTEGGATGTFTVVLNSEPTTDVVIDISSNDSAATVDLSQLTFTNLNWDTPQTVTVTAPEDANTISETPTITVAINDAASDNTYDAVANQTVNVTVTDDDTASEPGITLSQSFGTTAVTEGGATDSFTLVLDTEPTDSVVISLTSSVDVTSTPSSITFTTGNWSTPQTITVSAVNDDLDEDTENATIDFVVVSTDSDYDARPISQLTIPVTDNDTAGVTLSETTATVAEDSGTDTYTVVLNSQPTSTVTISLTETSADFSISTSTLIFTTSNWDTPQTITITAISDSSVEGTETANITHSASSSDTDYDGIPISNVVVTITDNDTSSGGGGGGSYDITPPTNISLLINSGTTSTVTTTVVLSLGATGASYMMISNYSSFTSANWENYSTSKTWELVSGEGMKYVYVKYKDYSGNISSVVTSSILLMSTSSGSVITTTTDDVVTSTTPIIKPEDCPLTLSKAYKSSTSPAVYYITTDCTKRAFTRSDIFFTYFNSWSDVQIINQIKLNSIPNDPLGFMPYGPKYDPKYGALVKIVKDPKVYLLLGTEKYWITSELVFNALNYKWNWIEDVDERLLDKYTTGSEITYINHHPNYTLIKYSDSNKVYRLEPKPTDDKKQVKRWIVDEQTFKSLNFRWDRIVTIDDTEIYEDGANLQVVVTKPQLTTTLNYGAIGEQVEILQTMLTKLGFYNEVISGEYDASTVVAVRSFQVANGLNSVGNVGPQTMALLNSKF